MTLETEIELCSLTACGSRAPVVVSNVMATSQDVEFQGLHVHACTTNGLEETFDAK